MDDVYTVAEDGSTPSSNDLAGVQTSLRVDWFQQHGSWATVYDEAYSHATQLSDVDLTPYGDRCVFVGAKASVSADAYLVGAFGPASVVNVFTSLNVPQFYAGDRLLRGLWSFWLWQPRDGGCAPVVAWAQVCIGTRPPAIRSASAPTKPSARTLQTLQVPPHPSGCPGIWLGECKWLSLEARMCVWARR